MRIVATLKDKEEIDILKKSGTDVFLLETDMFTRAATSAFSLEQIAELTKAIHRRRRKVYVLFNTLIQEEDLELLTKYLSELKKMKIDGIVCYDLTVIIVARKLDMGKYCIYQPGTMTTNPKDVTFYSELGIKGITISREITIDEIRAFFLEGPRLEFSLAGHGYQEMFYSRRKLVSSYLRHHHISTDMACSYDLKIRELQRPDTYFPILEDRYGTMLFRAKKLQSFAFMDILEPHLADLFLERKFMSDTEYLDSIRAYKHHGYSLFIDKYKDDYDTGFYLLPTETLKGETS